MRVPTDGNRRGDAAGKLSSSRWRSPKSGPTASGPEAAVRRGTPKRRTPLIVTIRELPDVTNFVLRSQRL